MQRAEAQPVCCQHSEGDSSPAPLSVPALSLPLNSHSPVSPHQKLEVGTPQGSFHSPGLSLSPYPYTPGSQLGLSRGCSVTYPLAGPSASRQPVGWEPSSLSRAHRREWNVRLGKRKLLPTPTDLQLMTASFLMAPGYCSLPLLCALGQHHLLPQSMALWPHTFPPPQAIRGEAQAARDQKTSIGVMIPGV